MGTRLYYSIKIVAEMEILLSLREIEGCYIPLDHGTQKVADPDDMWVAYEVMACNYDDMPHSLWRLAQRLPTARIVAAYSNSEYEEGARFVFEGGKCVHRSIWNYDDRPDNPAGKKNLSQLDGDAAEARFTQEPEHSAEATMAAIQKAVSHVDIRDVDCSPPF